MAITINDYCKKAFKRFVSIGMTKEGAAGMCGNLYSESAGFYANRVEFLCLQRMREFGIKYKDGSNYTDETYTKAINEGYITKEEFMHPLLKYRPTYQYGYGINQATSPNRKALLYSMTVEKGKSIADEDAQLDYIIYELEHSYSSVLSLLKITHSIREASDKVLKEYEVPADWKSLSVTRANYGQQIYDALKNDNVKGDGSMSNVVQKVIDDAVDFAVKIASDNSHGYSQAVRSLYNITNPTSFDCSSLTCTAYYYAFMKNGLTEQANYLKAHCSYTGNMLYMTNCGFEIVATNQTAHASMQKGDLELNTTYHVAMAIDNNNIVHARSSEGTSNTTDDSGNEIRVQEWYNYSYGWTHRLRFTGKGINLNNSSVNNNITVPTGGNTNSNTNYGTILKKGSTGSAVVDLQKKLIKLGYSCGDAGADGDFGSMTDAAVKRFQAAKGLVVDGEVGPITQNALTAAISALNNTGSQSSTTTTKNGYMVKVTDSELNIRSGPGTNYNINGVIRDYGTYTIVEENNGWGKLKSGAGWICLDYAKKV